MQHSMCIYCMDMVTMIVFDKRGGSISITSEKFSTLVYLYTLNLLLLVCTDCP